MEFTVTTRVDGVAPDAAETPSQLGEIAMANGSTELPVRVIDWPAGFAAPACAENVKLVGLATSVGLLETTRLTGKAIGEFVAPALVIEIVAL